MTVAAKGAGRPVSFMIKHLYRSLDKRLYLAPLLDALRQGRPADYRSPLDAPPFSPGRVALLLVAILLFSGMGLTLFYTPTADRAASSLASLHQNQPAGWLLHNLHRWSALFLLATVMLHALRVWLARAYRYPRDLNWWLGLCLYLLVVALGGTGYLLRWDIKAFALMDLVLSSLSTVPILGPLLIAALLGGSEPDVVPLYRGYALHVWFLPVLLILLVAVHLLITWKQGLHQIPAIWQRWPAGRRIHFVPALLVLFVLLALAVVTPHQSQAGPAARSVWPHPDWLLIFYFLPFWFFQGNIRIVGTLLIPLGILIFLILAPKLHTRRVVVMAMAVAGIAGLVWLFGQTATMGYRVPLQGCNACHRPTIVGGAPAQLSEFKIRDPDWLVFHLQNPQESLLVPFSAPRKARRHTTGPGM